MMSLPPDFDTDLLTALERGDGRALARARRHLRPYIVGWCRRIAGGKLDAVRLDDLVDDILYDFLLDCAERVTDPRSMWGYLKLMSARRTRRLLARQNRHEVFDSACSTWAHTAHDAVEYAVDRHRLADCLARLTARARRVLELRFCVGCKDPEIGRRLAVSSQYTGRVRKKALASLRECMESPDEA